MSQNSASRGSIIMLIVMVVNSLLGYIFTIGIAWLLPAADYGTYGAASSILGILLLIVNGLPWAATKYLAEERTLEEKNIILKSILVWNIPVSIVVIFVFLMVYIFIKPLNAIPVSVIIVVSSVVFVYAIRTVYLRTIHGQMRFGQFGIASVIETLVRVIAGLLLVWLGFNVAGALSGYLASGVVIVVICVFLLRDMKFWEAKGWASPRVFIFAWSMFVGLLGITLLNQMDILVVKFVGDQSVSDQAVGYYQSIRMIAEIPFILAGALASGVFPFISRFANDSRTYALFSLRYVFLFSVAFAVFLALVPQSVITLFFPEAYSEAATALSILAFSGLFLAIIQTLAQNYQALGKPNIPAAVLIIGAVMQVGLLFALVPKMGITGAAIAVAATCLFGAAWLFIRFRALYQLKIQIGSIVRFIIVLAVSGLVLYFFPHGNRILLIVDILVTSIVYIYLLIALGFIFTFDFDVIDQVLPGNNISHSVLRIVKGAAIRLGCRQ